MQFLVLFIGFLYFFKPLYESCLDSCTCVAGATTRVLVFCPRFLPPICLLSSLEATVHLVFDLFSSFC